MKKVIVLGSTGMLGSMVYNYLSHQTDLEVWHTTRKESKDANHIQLEATDVDALERLLLQGFDYVINCIGIIKPHIHDLNDDEIITALKVNSIFPHQIAMLLRRHKLPTHVLQIATDCVYNGLSFNNYTEDCPADAEDWYGRTKELGEVRIVDFFHNIRCSIIGLEMYTTYSLISWFLSQKKEVTGYTNHFWNGVTTLQFAKVCYGIIKNGTEIPNMHHLVPADSVDKYELLNLIQSAFNSPKVDIVPSDRQEAINRVLDTNNEKMNEKLWRDAGYAEVPCIADMVYEFANYGY